MKVEPGRLTFVLADIQLKGGFVWLIADDKTEIVTLFVTTRDVKFEVSAEVNKPEVEALIGRAVTNINACVEATITVSSKEKVIELQGQLEDLGAFARGQ